jgi:hypothetical protein
MHRNDIPPAYFSDRVLAVMGDGRWYSSAWLKKFMRPSSKGMITGTLAQLLRYGQLQRAKNPAFNGRPFHKDMNCKYLYRITGKGTPETREICGGEENYKAWLLMRNLPKAWIEIIK